MTCNSEKPDFKKAQQEADLILLSSPAINRFPFSVKKVVKGTRSLTVRSYSKAGSYGSEISDFGSDDAIIIYRDNALRDKGIIFYNDLISSKARIRFSLCHEYGHHLLDHDPERKKKYDRYEVEANFFAAQLLMPEQLINELRRRGAAITVDNLVNWFGVSKQAAQKRINSLQKINFDYRNPIEKENDQLIVLKFKHFLDEIFPCPVDYYDFEEEENYQLERNRWY